jgi:hypothetical protein
MASGINPGDIVPAEVLQELADEIEGGNRLFPPRLLGIAFDYARRYLRMDQPSESDLWDYIVDRLQLVGNWYYADLEVFPDRFGYAIINADGIRLYIKLMYDNQFRVRVLSFHEGY